MARDWEAWFQNAARPASPSEEEKRDRTEERIRDAIRASRDIPSSVKVYVKGSYKTNTNVRQDADVDVCVEWQDFAYVHTWGETEGLGPAELNYIPAAESVKITPTEFRIRLERALIVRFGAAAVDTSGDKAIDVEANSTTLDADVIPCFVVHRYDRPTGYVVGQRLFPKKGGFIDNFPQQNYDNGVTKNTNTGRRYKQVVRCIKKLETEMYEEGRIPRDYPGYLIECLAYNVPNGLFGHSLLTDDVKETVAWIWGHTKTQELGDKLEEVNELLMIFRGRRDRSVRNAHAFAQAAWNRIHE
jgi:hypothetical protein